MSPTCWVLNLDAELELQQPERYRRSSRMAANIESFAQMLAPKIEAHVGGSVCLRQDAHHHAPGWHGCSYCPTPRALAELASRRVEVPEAPSLEVLCRVNHRRFGIALADSLGVGSPRSRFVDDIAQLDATLSESPWPEHGWLLKRPLGFSGRQRKRVRRTDEWGGAARRWAEASMTDYGGGLVVEPWRETGSEFATHGSVDRDGLVTVQSTRTQRCDEDGRWLASTASCDAPPEAMTVAREVGVALHRVGYFGPFCVDGYRCVDGGVALLSEVNARYSMGWFG